VFWSLFILPTLFHVILPLFHTLQPHWRHQMCSHFRALSAPLVRNFFVFDLCIVTSVCSLLCYLVPRTQLLLHDRHGTNICWKRTHGKTESLMKCGYIPKTLGVWNFSFWILLHYSKDLLILLKKNQTFPFKVVLSVDCIFSFYILCLYLWHILKKHWP
jgi:hypothetical protein